MIRRLQDAVILSVVLALCIFGDSELVERFAKPAIELGADWVIALEEGMIGGITGMQPRSTTTVVMITEADSPAMTDAWPLPIDAYSQFLSRAYCLGASKVYLDVGLPHELRDSNLDTNSCLDPPGFPPSQTPRGMFCAQVNRLRTTLSQLTDQSKKDPCLTHPPRQQRHTPMPILLSEQYDKVLRKLSEPTNQLNYASAFVTEGNLYGRLGPPDPESRERLPTAAFMLARPECVTGHGIPESDHCLDEFEVRDTSMTPALQQTFSHPELDQRRCLYRGAPLIPQIGYFIQEAFNHLISDPRDDWELCPPTLTVRWRDVFDPYWETEMNNAFTGHLVLLSAALPGVSDTAQTSLHKDLPGVYLHALATESLSPASVNPARVSKWQYRILLFILGNFTVLQLRQWRERTTGQTTPNQWGWVLGRREPTPFAATKETSIVEMIAEGDDRLGEHRQETIVRTDTIRTEKSPVPTSKQARSPKRPVLLVLMALAVIYSFLEWKLALAGRDLLFFYICNVEDIWWLDPTQVFGRLVNIFKDRLQIN